MSKSPFPAVRCSECGTLYSHEPVLCRECHSEILTSESVAGQGEVYASTTIRVPGSEHKGEEPFVVGLVDVGTDETIRITARINVDDDLSPSDVGPGTPVEFLNRKNSTFYFRVRQPSNR